VPRPTTGPAIEVRDLTIRYGDQVAVDALSLEVEPGHVLALLGPNGAGKTSTVETLEGYRRPDGGQVRVLGLDPIADHAELTTRMGVMLQQGGVYTAARPEEVLRLFASYYEDPADPEELLERVGLAEHRRSSWKSLSGGEQQRLSLALALVPRPEVAFLDEPTAGIDPSGRQLIRRVIAELQDQGVTVLLTTHDLDEAEKLADQVVIIDRGRVLAKGSPAELMAAGQSDEVRFGAAAGLDVVGLSARLGRPVTEVAPGEYRVDAAPTPATVAAITGWLAERDLALADLRAGRQRLEDVFLRLTEAVRTEEPRVEADQTGRRRRGRR
jgi:ABC-2 type transport system ATP-binding protein